MLTFAVVIEPHSFRWAASGMENSIAVLLLTIAAYLFWLCMERPSATTVTGLAIIAALLPFARPEFAPLSLAMACFAIFAAKKKPLIVVFFAAAAACALTAFTLVWFCFGALIPQSAAAKAIFLKPAIPYSALLQCGMIILSGCLCAIAILILIRGLSREAKNWRLATVFSVSIAILYLGYRNQLVSTRYASYLCAPIVLAAAAVAAERLSASAKRFHYAKILIVLHLMISGAVLAYLYPATRAADYRDIKKVGEFVASHTSSDARIAISEVGAFGFYSDRYVIDLVGLTDAATLNWARQNGGVIGREGFENLLIARGATNFIDTRSSDAGPVRGRKLDFNLIFELPIKRDIMSISGQPAEITWRVYEVRKQVGSAEKALPSR